MFTILHRSGEPSQALAIARSSRIMRSCTYLLDQVPGLIAQVVFLSKTRQTRAWGTCVRRVPVIHSPGSLRGDAQLNQYKLTK